MSARGGQFLKNTVTLLITIVICLVLAEAALRMMPSLIGLSVLQRMQPDLRAEIASRLGLPTAAERVRFASDERSDGGPDIFLYKPDWPHFSPIDPEDAFYGAVDSVPMDAKGFCNTPEKAARMKTLMTMEADKIAPFTLALLSDQAREVTGQIFGVRNNEIFLFSQPRPIRTMHNAEGWSVQSCVERAIPAFRSVAIVLKSEGQAWEVMTPSGEVRLVPDRRRDESIALAFDATADPPQPIVSITRGRGSRTVHAERPVKAGTPSSAALTEDDVIEMLVEELKPWLA